MRELSCYDAGYPPCLGTKPRGEITTTTTNRRKLLFLTGAAVAASTVRTTANATEPPNRDRVQPGKLRTLIEAHIAAYASLGRTVRKTGSSRDYDSASREEESALLAICAYPAATDDDRLVKGQYLLEIEARGELDLPRQIQALLRSTMPKA